MYSRSGHRSPVADPLHPRFDDFTPVPDAEPGTFFVRYEMALTAAELHRLAIHLDGGTTLDRNERSVAATLPDGRRWSIALGPERTRRIALVALPICDAEIRLVGWSADEAEAFLARFHRVFRKGGG